MKKYMRKLVGVCVAAAPALFSGSLMAQDASRPAPINPLSVQAVHSDRILIFPFAPANPADSSAWYGKGIQQTLVADLTQAAPARVISLDQLPANLNAAIAMGREQGARYVVVGGFAVAGSELRITGQTVDVETGQPMGGLKVTGDPGQIFRLEDALTAQVKQQLNITGPTPDDNVQVIRPQQAPVQQPLIQQPVVQQPLIQQPLLQQPGPASPPVNDSTGVRTDYAAPQSQPLSEYATVPQPTTYGAPAATTYVYNTPAPTYYDNYPYSYYYPYSYPYYSYGLGFGLGYPYLGFYYGGYGRGYYPHHYYNGYYGRSYSYVPHVYGGFHATPFYSHSFGGGHVSGHGGHR